MKTGYSAKNVSWNLDITNNYIQRCDFLVEVVLGDRWEGREGVYCLV